MQQEVEQGQHARERPSESLGVGTLNLRQQLAIQDELDAYNPLIPDASNLKATLMIEYADPVERARELARLRGIEHHIVLELSGAGRVVAVADEDIGRSNEEKTSAVHFLRFELTAEMVAALKYGVALGIGVDHPNYTAEIPAAGTATRTALVADLA